MPPRIPLSLWYRRGPGLVLMPSSIIHSTVKSPGLSATISPKLGELSNPAGAQTLRRFSSTPWVGAKKVKDIQVNFEFPDGSVTSAKGAEGDSLLDLVVDNNIDIDGFGACEGTLACSTCHLILTQKDYDNIPDQPTDEEYDMLDLAYGLTDTSRLGCQIFLTKDLDGFTVNVPPGIADARN